MTPSTKGKDDVRSTKVRKVLIFPEAEHYDSASPLSLNPDTCKMNGY